MTSVQVAAGCEQAWSDAAARRLSSLPPDPHDGDATLQVTCFVDRARTRGSKHGVTINADWSVSTPHDLEAERTAAAFGAYVSCLDLVDAVVPAARTYLSRQLRRELPRLRREAGGHWAGPETVDQCRTRTSSFATAQAAAAHLRSSGHVAWEHGARRASAAYLGGKLLLRHGYEEPAGPSASVLDLAGRCVRRAQEALLLWEAGIAPEVVQAIYEETSPGRPLPVAFYLGVLTRRPDLRWVHDTAAKVPEREVHEWLAWSETDADRRHPHLRGRWLELGVSGREIPVLSEARYAPGDVEELSRELVITPTAAAVMLATWVGARCAPAISDLIAVTQRSHTGLNVVTKTSVDRLMALLRAAGVEGTRLEAAYALALCGSPRLAATVAGVVRSLHLDDLDRALSDLEEPCPTLRRTAG